LRNCYQHKSAFETEQLIGENHSKQNEIARLNLEIHQLLVEKENLSHQMTQLETSRHQIESTLRKREQLLKEREVEYLTKLEQMVSSTFQKKRRSSLYARLKNVCVNLSLF
jgi:predicted  nucleic acid-binding Zn-ribbon protein